MLVGFITAKAKVTKPETADLLSSFIIKITLPALLFVSFQLPFKPELMREAGIAIGLSAIVYGLSFLLAAFYPKILGIKGPERGVHRYALIISNCSFIGYPMVEAVLGPAYLFHAVIFNIPYNFLAFSVCAWLIAKEGQQSLNLSWKTFLNVNVIATFLGFLCFLLSIRLPEPLYRAVKMTGDMTSPLSMILIGTILAQANIRQVFSRWQVYVTVAMRLFIIPCLAGIIFYLLGIRGPLFVMAVLITAMPIGSATSINASYYKTAPDEAGSLVFLSTMLCMATIPLAVFFASMFG